MKISIEGIKKVAKQVLKKQGSHSPQFIAETREGRPITALLDYDEKSKEKVINELKALVQNHNIDTYWLVSTVWMSKIKAGEKIVRNPIRDVDRVEALMISEFNRSLENKTIIIPFDRVRNAIVFHDEQQLKEANSVWNAYLELEGVQEKIGKEIKEVDKSFYNKIAKDAFNQYKDELKRVKSNEEIKEVFKKMALAGVVKLKEQNKTILEDIEKSEEK